MKPAGWVHYRAWTLRGHLAQEPAAPTAVKPSTDLARPALVPYRSAQAGAAPAGGAARPEALGAAGEQRARPAAAVHEEKVTLSAEAREAARDLPPAASGEVRWYRASGVGRSSLLTDVPEVRAAVSTETAPRPTRVSNPRAAVSAYTGAMAEALAA